MLQAVFAVQRNCVKADSVAKMVATLRPVVSSVINNVFVAQVALSRFWLLFLLENVQECADAGCVSFSLPLMRRNRVWYQALKKTMG